jgi:hypothetical protein
MNPTLHPMKVVTIVCEAVASERLLRLLRECGAHGATVVQVAGVGATGERPADIGEAANVRVLRREKFWRRQRPPRVARPDSVSSSSCSGSRRTA